MVTIHITILLCTILLYVVLKKTFPESKSKKSRFAIVVLFPICMYTVYFIQIHSLLPTEMEPNQIIEPVQLVRGPPSSIMSDPFPTSSTMSASTST